MVLAIVMLLSLLVFAFVEEAQQQIRHSAVYPQQDDLRRAAYDGLEATMATLAAFKEVEEQLWGPAQGWGDPLKFAHFTPSDGVEVSVRIEDDSSRLPFNSLDYDQLVALFDYLGVPDYQSAEIADSILDWGDEDDLKRLNGFDGDEYERLDPPFRPANRPPRDWSELERIPAVREALFDEEGNPGSAWKRLRQMASLDYTGAINLNTAQPEVLYALEELQVLDAQEVIDYRDGFRSDSTEDDRYYRTINNAPVQNKQLVTVNVQRLWIEVTARRGDAAFTLLAYVQTGNAGRNNQQRGDDEDNGSGDDNGGGGDENGGGQSQEQANGQGRDQAATQNQGTQSATKASERYPFPIVRLQEHAKIGWTPTTVDTLNDDLE